MDKDEILEKSRKEHKDMDFVELEAINKANGVAINIGLAVCVLLMIIHAIFQVRMDNSAWTVMFSILTADFLYKYHKLRRWHELMIGLIYLFITVFFFVWYLRDLLGVS